MSNKVILDSSALLTVLKQEEGIDIVKPLLKFSVMSTVNISETLSILTRINIETAEALDDIMNIVPDIIPFDIEQAGLAANLQVQTKHLGLSLGDRACISLGINLGLPIYTADKVWQELKLDNADIRMIR